MALLGLAVSVWIFLQEGRALDQSWLEADEQWNAEILDRLEAIDHEMATQSQRLDDILDAMNLAVTRRDQDLEELEAEHEELREAIQQVAADFAYWLGVHQGSHR